MRPTITPGRIFNDALELELSMADLMADLDPGWASWRPPVRVTEARPS